MKHIKKHIEKEVPFIENEEIGTEEFKVPALHESASMSEDGTINLSVSNLSATDSYEIETILVETEVKEVEAEILTGEIGAYNTFDNPEVVKSAKFEDYKKKKKGISFKIPACSVVCFKVK